MPSWEEFFPSISRPKPGAALAIVGRGPSIRLTEQAVKAMGDPTHVVMLLDRKGQRVGIQAAQADVHHAFPLKRYGGRNTLPQISAGGFTKWANIDTDRRIEYPVELVDNQIAFRLNSENQQTGEFEEFRYKSVALIDLIPNISIARSGNITFNQPARALVAPADRVVLLYDSVSQLVGFRPAPDAPNARQLRQSVGQHTWTLAGEGFLKQFRIPHDAGRSYEPRIEDGVVVIDLNHPKPARRQGKKAKNPAPALAGTHG